MKNIVIDIHAHFTPNCLFERYAAHATQFPGVRLLRDDKGTRMQFPGADPTRPIMPKLCNLDDRRAWMDKNGIDHQLVSGWVDSFGYELQAKEGLAWSRFMNDCMWDQLQEEPRFTPLATVPLQDGKLAAEVLVEAMSKGFGGVMIGTLPKGNAGNLDSPSLDPFWETASKLGTAVYLHPMYVCGDTRYGDYELVNAIGRVVESSIAVSRLLFSGHLLKFSGLKLILSHGGAAIPYMLGRLARNHQLSQGKYADPRQGFESMYFDSCVFDTDTLEYLIHKSDARRVMLGSDAPFSIGDPSPKEVIANGNFSDAQKNEMLSKTAQSVFRVRPDCWSRINRGS